MTSVIAHSFDVELSGPIIGKHALLSIASCAMEITASGKETIIDRFIAVVKHEDIEWYPKTKQFWSRYPEALKFSTTGGVPIAEVAKKLDDHLTHVQTVAMKRRLGYFVVTDNSYCDIPWIDWLLGTHAGKLPIRYSRIDGSYMSCSQMVNMVERAKTLQECGDHRKLKTNDTNDHNPLNDAINTAKWFSWYHQNVKRRPPRQYRMLDIKDRPPAALCHHNY